MHYAFDFDFFNIVLSLQNTFSSLMVALQIPTDKIFSCYCSAFKMVQLFVCDWKLKQAGLSRATLEFPSESSPNFPLRTHKSHIERSSSIGGRLPLEVVFHWRLSSIGGHLHLMLKFGDDMNRGCWDNSTFKH